MDLRHRRITLAVLGATTSLLLTVPPADASPVIKITKIHYAQTGTNLDTEYIVFKNTTAKKRWISGWRVISSPSTDNQRYVFPTTAIPAGGSLVLYSGRGVNAPGKRYWNSASPIWNNNGDLAVLRNASGVTVTSCRYAGGGTTAYC